MSQFICQRIIAGLLLVLLTITSAPGQLVPGVLDMAEIQDVAVVAHGQGPADQLRVLGIGDFNADGLSDLLLGAFLADGPESQRVSAGSAYIIFGDQRGIGLRDLGNPEDRREDVLIWGAEPDDRMGVSATIGDMNNDGFDDMVFGAPGADGPANARTNAGEVYVYLGGPDLAPETVRDTLETLGRGPDITILGEELNDGLGAAVALGDINDDGLTDLIISAPQTFGPGNIRAASGSVYIIFGGPRLHAGRVIDLADPLAGADVVIHGADALDGLGFAIKAGDLNDDGVDDLAFSAPTGDGPSNQRTNAGEVYVLFGGGDLGNQSLRDLAGIFGPPVDLTIFGQDPRDSLGSSMAIGDVSGDGINDLLIGASGGDGPENTRLNAGEMHVILGSPTLPFDFTRDLASQFGRAAELTIFGVETGDQFGFSLALGELSGDGIPDLIIGAEGGDGVENQRTDAGEAYVIFCGTRLLSGVRRDMAGQVGPPADVTLVGPDAGVRFGATLAVADLDQDGANDLIIAAPFVGGPENTRASAGAAFVISGK